MSSQKSALVHGGILKSSTKVEFISHTIPDIQRDTFILGVCGVPEEISSPLDDGWFIADFYAFNYLLHGLGVSQKWLACSAPRTIIEKHGEYLHGNPYMHRKVVLSYPLLNSNRLSEVTVVSPENILDEFLSSLKTICDTAREKKAPVLVFVFGHGQRFTHSVSIGSLLLSMSAFDSAIGAGVDVTLVNTACFSGGWSVNPQLNVTSLVAAGPDQESESWAASKSIGRCCGSIYATALIKALSDVASPLAMTDEVTGISGSLQPTKPSRLQAETFNEFAKTGFVHDIRFNAQDDDWENSWMGRTGIPLVDFEKRWSSLESRASSPASSVNRDPSALNLLLTDPVNSEPILGGKLGSLFGGTARSQRRHVCALVKSLLETCPGTWTRGYGPLVRGRLSRYLGDNDQEGETASIFFLCEYRFSLIRYADILVESLSLPHPGGVCCSEFFYQEWMHAAQRLDLDVHSLNTKIVDLLDCNQVFLPPTPEQGPPFYDPIYYVAASLIEGHRTMEDTISKVVQMGNSKQILTVGLPI
ncbi:hypothetical protein V8E54_004400 [Elaphomyces granulatus]